MHVEVYLKLKHSIFTLVCLAVFCGEAQANNDLSGMINGKKWNMSIVTLKKKIREQMIEIEFFDKVLSESDICSDIKKDNSMLLQIPINSRNASGKLGLDYDNTDIQIASKNEISYYHELALNEEDLNSQGLAYVKGRLEIFSKKTKTSLSGEFKARVCNLKESI